MKVITICGSLKFKDEMMQLAAKTQIEGNIVLTPIFPVKGDKTIFTEEQLNMLRKMHKEKIRMSDAIFVLNIDNYIGSNTESEIEFAKSLNKEILYYTDL